MSLWTNGSSVDLFPGTKTPPPDSNSSNRTVGPPGAAPLDLSRAVPVGMVLASFIMFAIVGNILVILSVVCNRHLRIPTNYFIINLAIADLLLGTTVLPVSATLEVIIDHSSITYRSLINGFCFHISEVQTARKRNSGATVSLHLSGKHVKCARSQDPAQRAEIYEDLSEK